MKKRLVALCIAFSLVAAMSITSFAATPSPSNTKTNKTATNIGLADLERLVAVYNEETIDGKKLGKVSTVPSGSNVRMVNGKRLSATEWVIRLNSLENPDVDGDYYVFVTPWVADPMTGKSNEPSEATHTKLYGPDWAYCGLFGWEQEIENGVPVQKKNLIGYAVAQRIKRWPLVEDLTYTVGSDVKKVKRLDAKGNVVKDIFGNPIYDIVPLDETKFNKDGTPYTLIASAKAVAASKGVILPNIVGSYDTQSSKDWLKDRIAEQQATGRAY